MPIQFFQFRRELSETAEVHHLPAVRHFRRTDGRHARRFPWWRARVLGGEWLLKDVTFILFLEVLLREGASCADRARWRWLAAGAVCSFYTLKSGMLTHCFKPSLDHGNR